MWLSIGFGFAETFSVRELMNPRHKLNCTIARKLLFSLHTKLFAVAILSIIIKKKNQKQSICNKLNSRQRIGWVFILIMTHINTRQ